MDPSLLERLAREIEYEYGREGPPPGFPAFPDIPIGRYTDPAFFELEREHLWSKVWVLAGRSEELPEPGSYRVWDDLGMPVLLIRGNDGELRAFYNSCRHRGAPVVREPCGRARAFRCQYHSWTYNPQGELIAVPDERDFVNLSKDQRGLVPLRCEVWDGWVFVNRDLNAQPLLEFLSPIPDQLAEVQGARLRTVHKKTTLIPCNWKVTVEAFLEVYHFRHIHSRGGDSGLDNRGATMGLLPNGSSRMITPYSDASARARGLASNLDWQPLRDPGFADIETVNAMVRSTSTAYNIFPNLITPLAASGFPFLLAWPVDIRTTRFDVIHYAPDWGDGEPPEAWKARLAGFDLIMEEDTRNMAPMQQSLESPGLPGIPINYQERRIWHLHEMIDRVIGPERIPERLRVPQLLEKYVCD